MGFCVKPATATSRPISYVIVSVAPDADDLNYFNKFLKNKFFI